MVYVVKPRLIYHSGQLTLRSSLGFKQLRHYFEIHDDKFGETFKRVEWILICCHSSIFGLNLKNNLTVAARGKSDNEERIALTIDFIRWVIPTNYLVSPHLHFNPRLVGLHESFKPLELVGVKDRWVILFTLIRNRLIVQYLPDNIVHSIPTVCNGYVFPIPSLNAYFEKLIDSLCRFSNDIIFHSNIIQFNDNIWNLCRTLGCHVLSTNLAFHLVFLNQIL